MPTVKGFSNAAASEIFTSQATSQPRGAEPKENNFVMESCGREDFLACDNSAGLQTRLSSCWGMDVTRKARLTNPAASFKTRFSYSPCERAGSNKNN